jgi:cysteinyl-tRNA synthetase
MGSAYPTIAADAIARFQRLQGRQVTFITGTDEHGEKIALAAAKRGMEPKQHCDDIVASYKQLWQDVSPAVPLQVCRSNRRATFACCVAPAMRPSTAALPSVVG